MRRDIRRRVFCPVISPAWRRRIGSGPLAAAVGRQREPLALVHEFRSGVVLGDLGAFDRCPATLRWGVFKSLGRVRRGPVGLLHSQKTGIKYKKPSYSGLGGECSAWICCRVSRAIDPRFCNSRALRIARYVADVKIGDEWLRNKTLCLTEI